MYVRHNAVELMIQLFKEFHDLWSLEYALEADIAQPKTKNISSSDPQISCGGHLIHSWGGGSFESQGGGVRVNEGNNMKCGELIVKT